MSQFEFVSGTGRATTLAEAISALADVVGGDAVMIEPGAVGEFHDPFEGPTATEHRPCVVVQPGSVEEVQAVVSLANRLGIHLWTSSMGRNFGYGGSAPVLDGTVVLNLRRLNRVLEIDARQGYVLIEPGVTFFQLHQALRDQDAPLMMSVPDLGWGSMIGNALEHGLGYNVMGDHAGAVCGLEVVLPDGGLLRTGQGAMQGSGLWNCHRRGFGPSIDDLFKQSNMGVVIKAGFWLMPRPERFVSGTVMLRNEQDIVPLVETVRPLLQDGVMQGVPMIVGNAPSDGAEAAGDAQTCNFSFENLRKALRPGCWNLRFGLYGADEMVAARRSIVERAFAAIPGAEIECRTYAGDVSPDEVDRRDVITAGVPNMVLLERLESVFGPGLGHQDFSPVLPVTGEAAQWYDAMVRGVMAEFGIVGAVGMLLHPRSMVGASMMMFDKNDSASVATVRSAVQRMCDVAASEGYAPYRAHVSLVDKVAGSFGFADSALLRTVERIKDALDPNGVLSPGNHGIWPAHLRDARRF